MNNFDLAKERREQDGTEWVFGALSQPGVVSIPLNEREAYLPIGELQFDSFVDFNDCASRSPVNHLEALFTYHYTHAMKPANKKWMEDEGYVVDSKVTFSDRFIAVLSGTTKQGNSLKAPVQAIHSFGLIPKSLLPKIDTLTWDEYYASIPQNLKDLGQEFLKHFSINYEQVGKNRIAEVVKDDMVGVAAAAWAAPVNGVYPKIDWPFNHAFLVYNLPKYQIFDNYEEHPGDKDFTKNIAPDYEFFDYGYRVYIGAEKVTMPLFLKNLVYGQTGKEVTILQEALVNLGYPIPHAVTAYYGRETKEALAVFQKDKGINDDGTHFGPRTRLALNVELNPSQSIVNSALLYVRTFFGL